jgi:hypothetical protein
VNLPPRHEQKALLRHHGFTAYDVNRMLPAELAAEYRQAVREGAAMPYAMPSDARRRQQQELADKAVRAAHMRPLQAQADHAVRTARAAHVRKLQTQADQAVQAAKDAHPARRELGEAMDFMSQRIYQNDPDRGPNAGAKVVKTG